MSDLVVTEATLLPNVDEADYHASRVRTPGPQTSQSALKLLIAPSTPREFQHRLVTPQEPKRVFDVGHAALNAGLEAFRSGRVTRARRMSAELEKAIKAAQDSEKADPSINSGDVAERLTALVEGLSERWLSGSITLERARQLLAGAITAELG